MRSVVELMGEYNEGLIKEDIELHSIYAGSAMIMFLSGICRVIIQRVVHWSSFAFLEHT